VLVATGAVQAARLSSRAWWLAVAVAAGVAGTLSLLAYGGLVAVLVPYAFRLWSTVSYLEAACGTVAFTALFLALWKSHALAPGQLHRSLPAVATAHAILGLLSVAIMASSSAYFGPVGYLRQVVGVSIGLLQLLAVVAVLASSYSRFPGHESRDARSGSAIRRRRRSG